MTKNTPNVRTRREQLSMYPESVCVGRYSGDTLQLELDSDDLDPDRLVEGPVLYVRCDIAHGSQTGASKKIEEEKAYQPLYSTVEKSLLDILQICQSSKMEPHDVSRVDQVVRAALTREGGV